MEMTNAKGGALDSYNLINSTEYAKTWQRRKAKTKRMTLEERAKKMVDALKREESEHPGRRDRDDVLKASIVRSMLRFRNLTGTKFDSAADAKNQDHDKFSVGAEMKHPE